MKDVIETVMIEGPNGPVRMNKSKYDADPKAYKLHKPTKAETEAEANVQTAGNHVTPVNPDVNMKPAPSAVNPDTAPTPEVPAPNSYGVIKDGKKFKVVGADGKAVEMDGVDPKGYETEQAAWDAVIAVQTHPAAPEAPKA